MLNQDAVSAFIGSHSDGQCVRDAAGLPRPKGAGERIANPKQPAPDLLGARPLNYFNPFMTSAIARSNCGSRPSRRSLKVVCTKISGFTPSRSRFLPSSV